MAIKRNKWLASAAGVAALSLTLTACGGDDDSGGDESSSSQTSAEESGSGDESSESGGDESSSGGDDAAAGGGNDKVITANGSEPQNPLIPANTTETGGGKILDMVFAKLIDYDSEGQSVMDVAESIESEDNKVWTIKIKDDRKFSDGTPVQAHNWQTKGSVKPKSMPRKYCHSGRGSNVRTWVSRLNSSYTCPSSTVNWAR